MQLLGLFEPNRRFPLKVEVGTPCPLSRGYVQKV